jgi:hypothetical protein
MRSPVHTTLPISIAGMPVPTESESGFPPVFPPGAGSLPGKITVRGGAQRHRASDASAASAFDGELARRQDARREEDGPPALAGAVTGVHDGGDRPGGGCG